MSTKRLLLIDGHSLAYRAYFALPPENFSTADGQTTNAVFGFARMLLTAVNSLEPTHVAVAFDLGRQTFRLEEYPEYKAGRAKTPEDFHGQVDLIKDMLTAFGVPVITREGYEADDLLASLARRGAGEGYDTLIASGDKDSFQLADDNITIMYPKRGFTDLQHMTPQAVEDKYGVTPANYRGLAALVGEKADNLPGVPGVGEKTAAKWLTKYGDLPSIIDNAEDVGGKVGQSLRDHIADVERNYRLNRLIDDLDIPLDLADAALGRGSAEEITELFDALEFRQLAAEIGPFLGGGEIPAPTGSEAPAPQKTDSIRAVAEAAAGCVLGVDVDLDTPDRLGFAAGDSAWLIDLSTLSPDAQQQLSALLTEHPQIAMHDAKPQIKALADNGLRVSVWTDTELAAYLLTPDARGYDLEELAQSRAGIAAAEPDGNAGTLLENTNDEAAARKAFLASRLAPILREQLDEYSQLAVLDDIEMPAQAVLAAMERIGINIDSTQLQNLIDEFGREADQSAEDAYSAIGHTVNLGSPKQLQTVLFDELDMPKTKKTKTGYTTNADALHDLFRRTQHPFLEHLLAHRERIKLKQTVVGLKKEIADDGRIHTTYLQTMTATGRLSSKDPNLQNIPVRTDSGRRIRGVFTADADAGFTDLMSADYSQIEMRIMAHLSGDEALIEAFRAGEDLHSFVAGQVFQIPVEDVSRQQREKVKAMSYGLVYGLSAYGLSNQLGISPTEASDLMAEYFSRFGAVKKYLDGSVEEARQRGYTQTMYGRRRYLPALQSSSRPQREMAERAALNSPIQGTAADIMKIAMFRIADALAEADLASRILLQVHDEVIVECAAGEFDSLEKIVVDTMRDAAELSVPLDVNVGRGPDWQSAAH
ncbi:DNA polymerase I [Brevibacterium sp. HMSC07C04]|uniref:DNA polymerase I n=1 Tax=Brevibacterium sp. HMSC07C04 TaxID=1581130 RepID=UPI0008A28681|nr:DNA polymerase I [Brevibacterium sp. HMSC07C04]OFS27182.1 DNA polymerase I [Brevibacterium sp. HMSC07C04]